MATDLLREDDVRTGGTGTAPEVQVVGIGASAGGLEALRKLFSRMPEAPGVAFVIVVHLSPDHESHLVELLQPSTKMLVQQVTETVALERNHVYVIPPNANLNTINTHLRLSALEQRRIERAPVDHFLRTLAATHDGAAVGVILSGAGSDGSLGIRQIKEHGGLTIVQDPHEAEYDGMPRNAIATGMVDLVLPLRDMARELVRFCAMRPRLPVANGNDNVSGPDNAVLQGILDTVCAQTGSDITMYTHASALRHIRKRMKMRRANTLGAYYELVSDNPREARALLEEFSLTVTEFFREPRIFERLQKEFLPAAFDRKQGVRDRVRSWSLGCSSGEEAYSIAILMLEGSAGRESAPALQVFATDLSSRSLARARNGVYPQEVAASVEPERLERFFERAHGHYRVRREVRDIVVFASHNLFKDAPYSHLDLIVCRNILCELLPEVRRGVLSLFFFALEPRGVLLVGDKDDVDAPDLFEPADGEGRFLRRLDGPRPRLDVPADLDAFNGALPRAVLERAPTLRAIFGHEAGALHRAAMEPYAPPSVLINADDDIVNYSSRSARYIRFPGGEPTRDVLKLVRPPLGAYLKPGLDAARKKGIPWRSHPIDMHTEDGLSRVVLHVDPVSVEEAAGSLLVVFDESTSQHVEPEAGVLPETLSGVEMELERANRQLQTVLSATEGDRHALAVANDVFGTANDEVRGVLEQLESSREELQAVNEELRTLDEENRQRLRELTRVSEDLQYLMDSTGVGTLFLDRELRIVRFTPPLSELFHIRRADVGRPLADLRHELLYDGLETDARNVLADVAPLDREVATTSGAWYVLRMLPYRRIAKGVDGVVVTLIDISDRRRAEERLRETDRRKDEFLAMLAHELRNPLAPITSGIEILKAASGDAHLVADVTSMMGRQSQQLVRLVDDLLEVSRISGGKMRLRKALVPLEDVIRDAVSVVRPLVERAGHDLAVELPAEPVVLDADPARLTQVFANLLNNAARYTPDGGRITLSARREDAHAVVVVRDNGVGISESALDHVFDMFYQERQSPHENSGLGIGLTLAKSLVEMHDGTITVASAGSNQGTEFRVRLPVGDRNDAAAATQAVAVAVPRARRVLIVDDNDDAARTLCLLLKSLGEHDVRIAFSGAQALEMAAQFKPEIVLLDLMMPDMDGFEVARRLRREPWAKCVRLVALTGWGQEEHRQRTREVGFDRHLTKPADVAALEGILREPQTER